MKINVKMEDKFGVMTDARIESDILDGNTHKHRTGRDFTDAEIKALKSAKLSPEANKKASTAAKKTTPNK